MRIERTFTTQESPESARVKIASYLEQTGYRPVSGGNVLTFERGSNRGSVTGSPPQSARTRMAVEVRTGYDQRTWVCAIAVVNLGAFARKDPAFWQQEMDALVASTGGTVADMSTAAFQALAPAFSVQQAGLAAAGTQADSRARSGANWFFWIAGLSMVNVIALRAGLNITFVIGLVGTLFIDVFAQAMVERLPDSNVLITVVALVAESVVAGIFVLFGVLARKKLKWAFIVGMVFYALDGIIWLILGEWFPALFHLWGLYGIFSGVRALGQPKTR